MSSWWEHLSWSRASFVTCCAVLVGYGFGWYAIQLFKEWKKDYLRSRRWNELRRHR